jgi:hypothetical protein
MGRERDHQSQPSAEVKENVQLCRYLSLGLHDLLQGKLYLNDYNYYYYYVTLKLVLKPFAYHFYENLD